MKREMSNWIQSNKHRCPAEKSNIEPDEHWRTYASIKVSKNVRT